MVQTPVSPIDASRNQKFIPGITEPVSHLEHPIWRRGELSQNSTGREGMKHAILYLGMLLMASGMGASGPSRAANTNGSGGDMPAFYDDELFTINFKELPAGGEQANLQHNGSINTIYMCDQCEQEGVMFISVLDAIQGDGFNPLWQEVQITFLTIPPQQFGSDNDVIAAAMAGQIGLASTGELYRCAVVGKK
jgi:hypothetical protein